MAKRLLESIVNIMFEGVKISLKAMGQAIKQEIDMSNEAAKIRQREKMLSGDHEKSSEIGLEEAMKILNVSSIDPAQIKANYQNLYEQNKQYSYIRTKVKNAKERLDLEALKGAGATEKTAKKTTVRQN